ncbi:hypothetical protein CC80DRAFT_548385 [Byssothecium circinans]|uniref:Uncharacterized protein n=1 Tax=Byssothecium circinans TaxID=147558 RepID=A0A6A5TUV1_9PLEO|nr:hypothetical protein CC80DRAFT_548385 [Byssothecium circinans]
MVENNDRSCGDVRQDQSRRRKSRGSAEGNQEHAYARRLSTSGSTGSELFDDHQLRRGGQLSVSRKALPTWDGQQEHEGYAEVNLDGAVDLTTTEDTDRTTHWAPAVTHETVKPHEHEIVEERVYREIHNHDVYHRILPVCETEILPARHFIQYSNGELQEVSEEELPGWNKENQRWYIGVKESPATEQTQTLPRQTEPKVFTDGTYMTPEGFPRRETGIRHPPVLEDLSDYTGPVFPIEFLHHEPEEAQTNAHRPANNKRVNTTESGSFSLTDAMGALSADPNGVRDCSPVGSQTSLEDFSYIYTRAYNESTIAN